jgi:hypothetical protein
MSIATRSMSVQVHLVLQSIYEHTIELSLVRAVACSRNSVYAVERRKDLPSPSRQSVNTLAGSELFR